MPIKVHIVLIFMPFDFVVSSSSQNSQSKGHTNIEGFTVYVNINLAVNTMWQDVCALKNPSLQHQFQFAVPNATVHSSREVY